jgi:hypothetical protein
MNFLVKISNDLEIILLENHTISEKSDLSSLASIYNTQSRKIGLTQKYFTKKVL